MKVIFAGPSLPKAGELFAGQLIVRPPAALGDVLAAVRDGATAIGIVDGNFEHTAPVWHKEILYALDQGVAVFGAASMGALRAAECDAYGMIGIGRIYESYASGERIDDADVALLHGPAELGYPALSLPLVNVDATLDRVSGLREAEIESLKAAARQIFYKERTWSAIVAAAKWPHDRTKVLQLIHASFFDQKREDAIAMARVIVDLPAQRSEKSDDWTFRSTALWQKVLDQPRN